MFTRNCPKCNKELTYSNMNNRNSANRSNTLCRSCAQLGINLSVSELASIRRKRTDSSTVPKAIKKPTTEEIYWAAGFLEGEGCFVGTRNTEMVEASQVNKEPLILLQEIFGGSIKLVDGKGKRNSYWLWRIWGGRARGVQQTLYNLLSFKRKEQIRSVLHRKV